MPELLNLFEPDLLTLDSNGFNAQWMQRTGPAITGKEGYYSYKYLDGYGGHTPAIIKGIWTTRIETKKRRTEREVIDEGTYLLTSQNTELLAFVVNKSENPSINDPDFIFIIKDTYAPQQDRSHAASLRAGARTKLKKRYKPELSW